MNQVKKLVVMGMLWLVAGMSWAGLPTQPVSYATSGEPMYAAARTIEKALGVRVVLKEINPDLVVTGKYLGVDGTAFMNDFAVRNKFVWAYRNDQITIAPLGVDLNEAPTTMESVPRPKSFSQVLYDPQDKNRFGLMIFQLHNSFADDKNVGGNVVVGAATLFRQLVGMPLNAPNTASRQGDKPAAGATAEKVTPISNSQKAQISILGLLSKNAQNEPPKENTNLFNDASTRAAYPDTRQNAILVRDRVALFEEYKRVVAMIDKPADMVQLDAYIVDIQKERLLEYGVDMSIGGANGLGNGLILGQWSWARLLQNLRAGETSGHTHFVSVPSVVSMNNLEAVFSARENFFIPVAGKEDASLNKVTAETLLRVTPSIANESEMVPFNQRRIRLIVNVQDAKAGVDEVTQKFANSTSENQINTQAVVRSGDTLAIGGHTVTRVKDSSSGFPFLARIPYLGGLFAAKRSESIEYVRMYMVRSVILGEDSMSAKGM